MWKDTIEVMCESGDYTLIHYIKGGHDEWNVAFKYDTETKEWASGNYCYSLESALLCMLRKMGSKKVSGNMNGKITVIMEEDSIERVLCSEPNFTYNYLAKGSWDDEEDTERIDNMIHDLEKEMYECD